MKDKEAIEMMERCKEEIVTLRRRLSEVEPKADAYEQLKAVIGMFPKPSVGYAEDIIWKLDKKISDLKGIDEQATEQSAE